jgi:TIR domain
MSNVFISHRTVDMSEAEKLGNEIQSAGYDVWLDKWEISIGDSIIERMNEGIEGSTYLILCYSAEGMAPWINREWMSALARQLNGYDIKILPALLTGGVPPAIMADIKYADLVQDWAKGIAELLQAIK